MTTSYMLFENIYKILGKSRYFKIIFFIKLIINKIYDHHRKLRAHSVIEIKLILLGMSDENRPS